MTRPIRTALSEFEALLSAERELLRNGDVEAVIGLSERKAALAGGLDGLDEATLERLRRELRRNGALIAAAAAGVRAAAAQLRALARAPGLTTYDGAGRPTTLAAERPGPPRRA